MRTVLHAKGAKAAPLQLWVDPDGNDAAAGTEAAPLQTLDGARTKVRTLLPNYRGVTVVFKDGMYPMTAAVRFDDADAGTAQGPIVYKAQNPGMARLSGFTDLTDWVLLDDEDPAYASIPEAARAHVYVADLTAAGNGSLDAGDLGVLIKRGSGEVWNSNVPAFLVQYEERQTLCRYPNTGWHTPTEAGSNKTTTFTTDYAGAQSWDYANDDVWVGGYDGSAQYNACTREVSSVSEAGLVTVSAAFPGNVTGDGRLYFFNAIEELDASGEYFIDRVALKCYWYAPNGDTSGAKLATATGAKLYIYPTTANKAMWLAFDGLVFEGDRSGTSDSDSSMANGRNQPTDVSFANCRFLHAGRTAAFTGYGGTGKYPDRWTFDGCDFYQCGVRALNLYGGNAATLAQGGHSISNCLFEQTPYEEMGQNGMCVYDASVGAAYTRCTFTNTHTTPFFGYIGTTVSRCEFDTVATQVGDYAAVQFSGTAASCGSLVQYCTFSNVVAEDQTWSNKLSCVYGEWCSGITVESCLFEDSDAAFWGNSARDCTFTNNVLIGIGIGARCSDVWRADQYGNAARQAVRLAALQAVRPDLNPWLTAYPYMAAQCNAGCSALTADAMNSTGNVFERNVLTDVVEDYHVYFGASVSDGSATWDWDAGNYSGASPGIPGLPDSLATTPGGGADLAGFVPWDVSDVGCRR